MITPEKVLKNILRDKISKNAVSSPGRSTTPTYARSYTTGTTTSKITTPTTSTSTPKTSSPTTTSSSTSRTSSNPTQLSLQVPTRTATQVNTNQQKSLSQTQVALQNLRSQGVQANIILDNPYTGKVTDSRGNIIREYTPTVKTEAYYEKKMIDEQKASKQPVSNVAPYVDPVSGKTKYMRESELMARTKPDEYLAKYGPSQKFSPLAKDVQLLGANTPSVTQSRTESIRMGQATPSIPTYKAEAIPTGGSATSSLTKSRMSLFSFMPKTIKTETPSVSFVDLNTGKEDKTRGTLLTNIKNEPLTSSEKIAYKTIYGDFPKGQISEEQYLKIKEYQTNKDLGLTGVTTQYKPTTLLQGTVQDINELSRIKQIDKVNLAIQNLQERNKGIDETNKEILRLQEGQTKLYSDLTPYFNSQTNKYENVPDYLINRADVLDKEQQKLNLDIQVGDQIRSKLYGKDEKIVEDYNKKFGNLEQLRVQQEKLYSGEMSTAGRMRNQADNYLAQGDIKTALDLKRGSIQKENELNLLIGRPGLRKELPQSYQDVETQMNIFKNAGGITTKGISLAMFGPAGTKIMSPVTKYIGESAIPYELTRIGNIGQGVYGNTNEYDASQLQLKYFEKQTDKPLISVIKGTQEIGSTTKELLMKPSEYIGGKIKISKDSPLGKASSVISSEQYQNPVVSYFAENPARSLATVVELYATEKILAESVPAVFNYGRKALGLEKTAEATSKASRLKNIYTGIKTAGKTSTSVSVPLVTSITAASVGGSLSVSVPLVTSITAASVGGSLLKDETGQLIKYTSEKERGTKQYNISSESTRRFVGESQRKEDTFGGKAINFAYEILPASDIVTKYIPGLRGENLRREQAYAESARKEAERLGYNKKQQEEYVKSALSQRTGREIGEAVGQIAYAEYVGNIGGTLGTAAKSIVVGSEKKLTEKGIKQLAKKTGRTVSWRLGIPGGIGEGVTSYSIATSGESQRTPGGFAFSGGLGALTATGAARAIYGGYGVKAAKSDIPTTKGIFGIKKYTPKTDVDIAATKAIKRGERAQFLSELIDLNERPGDVLRPSPTIGGKVLTFSYAPTTSTTSSLNIGLTPTQTTSNVISKSSFINIPSISNIPAISKTSVNSQIPAISKTSVTSQIPAISKTEVISKTNVPVQSNIFADIPAINDVPVQSNVLSNVPVIASMYPGGLGGSVGYGDKRRSGGRGTIGRTIVNPIRNLGKEFFARKSGLVPDSTSFNKMSVTRMIKGNKKIKWM